MKTCKQLFDLYVDLFIKTKSWGTDINLEKRCYIKSKKEPKRDTQKEDNAEDLDCGSVCNFKKSDNKTYSAQWRKAPYNQCFSE